VRDEGYIKFTCDWIEAPAPSWHRIRALSEWRELMHSAGLIGAYPDGIGFGNISVRDAPDPCFLITGSATGGHRTLRPDHFTRVVDVDLDGNFVRCRGPIRASSESLTHAAFYSASRAIQAVIHVHNAALWHRYRGVLPTTSEEVAYGTPAMAKEVLGLIRANPQARKQLVVMGGHEDGVMAYGASLGQAGATLLNCCERMFRGMES